MNKQKLKKLTWKYFWQQKFSEVWIVVLIPTLVVGLLYLLSFPMRKLDLFLNEQYALEFSKLILEEMNTFWNHMTYGFVGASILFLVILLIYVVGFVIFLIFSSIYELFCSWIKSNWKKAKERARKEIKNE